MVRLKLIGVAFLATILGAPNLAHSQVVLVGCTASLPGQPQTTARLVDIDVATGMATGPRDTGILGLVGIAVQPTSGMVFTLTTNSTLPPNSLARLHPISGLPTIVGSTGLPFIVEGDLAFSPVNGFLYGVGDLGTDLAHRYFFRIDPGSGTANVISDLPVATHDYSALAFSSSGTLYCIDTGPSGNSLLLTIDPTTGTITSSSTMNVNLGSAVGLALDPTTGTAYVADGAGGGTNLLYTLDIATSVLTPIGPSGISVGISGLAFVAIPESSSLLLMALPVMASTLRRVRKKAVAIESSGLRS